MIKRNTDRKLTLEQRITRLEHAIKRNSAFRHRVNEGLSGISQELEDKLMGILPDESNVRARTQADCVLVYYSLDFGRTEFYVVPKRGGFLVTDDVDLPGHSHPKFCKSLDDVADFIADSYEEEMG